MAIHAESADSTPRGPKATPPRVRSIPCINPATGADLGDVPAFSRARVEAAASDARAAFPRWRRLTFAERAAILLAGRDRLIEAQDELLDLLLAETGKVRPDAYVEFLSVYDTIGYYASIGAQALRDERISLHLLKNKRVVSTYAPRGLVVNIAPWNFPFDLAINPVVAALLAGNVAIIKPSEVTPRIALRAVELLREAGLPAGVLQVVTGYGDTGAALCDHADFITFTGSVETGRKVAVAAAERLIPCTLELGGKDPFVVLEDADLERAARGAVWGAFMNSGQVCMSVERVYVVDAVYDAFVERVVDLTTGLRQGVDTDGDTDVGSMTDPRQLETVQHQVADAVAKGARVLAGGERHPTLKGHFFLPTVLVDVDDTMAVMREETFGPLLPIQRVRDAEEAIRRANDSEFGLNASVWTKNKARGQQIARSLEAGAVCINDCIISYEAIEAPYGGVKSSGIGRRKGPDEIRKYCHQKTILEDILGLPNEPIWFPHSPTSSRLLGGALRMLYSRGLGGKVSALRTFFER